MGRAMRKIVKIDEEKCDGCGQCVPSCAEGAIEIIDGKARLVGENLCDGLGACLGECPRDAITIEERPAEAFDEDAVAAHLAPQAQPGHGGAHQGCPGSMMRKLNGGAAPAASAGPSGGANRESLLGHWPVQLMLLPEQGPIWDGADVLIAADCVAFAAPDFHDHLLAGKTLAIACPKLDDAAFYVEKLTRIFASNEIASITIAHMEVPCCFGLVQIVSQAIDAARSDIPVRKVIVTVDGQIQTETPVEERIAK